MKKSLIWAFILKKIILVICLLSLPAQAETKAEAREFTYEVYASGIHAVQAKMKFNVRQNDYDVAVDAKTRGWLGSLVPWEGVFKTEGRLIDGTFTPKQHQSIATWREETETKTFSYQGKTLKSVTIKEDGKPLEKQEIDKGLTNDTTDILSATLNVMKDLVANQKCAGESDVYDGKRRFTMFFRDKGQKNLSKSRYNIFSGPARYCTIEIEPKGGKWHKKPRGWLSIQEQGRQKGTLPSVWMGVVEGFEYAVPVKIMVKTNYGALMMHLTDVK